MADSTFEFFMTQTNKIPFIAPMHNHTCYELVYYLCGSGTLIIDSKEYTYKPNTFALIQPKHYHSEFATEDTEIMYIGFTNVNSEANFKSGLYNDFETNDILNILKTMNNELFNKKAYYLRRMEILTQDILILIERLCHYSDATIQTNPLENILKYIDMYYNTNIDMQALATSAGYSYHRFRHIFKEQLSVSPKQYILSRQINEAVKLLKYTQKSIGEISEECGFSSSTFFIQCFSKQVGTTPHKYRKNIKNNEMNIEYVEK